MPDLIQLLFGFPLWQWIIAIAAIIAAMLTLDFEGVNVPFLPFPLPILRFKRRKPKPTHPDNPDHVGAIGSKIPEAERRGRSPSIAEPPPRVVQNIGTMQGSHAIGNIDYADHAQILQGTGDNIHADIVIKDSTVNLPPSHLHRNASGTVQVSFIPQPSPQGFIPPPNVVKYIDRGDIERDVRASLRDAKLAAIVGVTSPGGAGKTELAIRAANELRSQFDAIFWITMTGREFESCVADLARQAGSSYRPNWICEGERMP